LFVVFAGKKQPKQVGKRQKLKKIKLRSDDDTFLKQFGKMHTF